MAAARVAGELPPLEAPREAGEPPEARGLRRDEVRLLVSDLEHDRIVHERFYDLPRWLSPGDVLVVNTSATVNAALPARPRAGDSCELHLSTMLPGNFWVVELREQGPVASLPSRRAHAGMTLELPATGSATLLAPYPMTAGLATPSRLWMAALELPLALAAYLEAYGFAIRYSYVKDSWPLTAYQTVFASEPGSAEMPSAGRPFTPELVTRLVAQGIEIVPILLHTGVASQEDHEPPYEEFYRVPVPSAERITAARRRGHRIIAVGTTVVRALETLTDERGVTSPGQGWTNLVVTPGHHLRSVSSIISGLHEPKATHLTILERVANVSGPPPGHLGRAYEAARRQGYLCHEFGDSHLILGTRVEGRTPCPPSASSSR